MASYVSSIFAVNLSQNPLSLAIQPPEGWTYEPIESGGVMRKDDNTVSIHLSAQPKERIKILMTVVSPLTNTVLVDRTIPAAKAQSELRRIINQNFQEVMTIDEAIVKEFSGQFRVLPEQSTTLPDGRIIDKGETRLYPNDQFSPIEYLAIRRLTMKDGVYMMWVFHKLKSPYPQVFENTVLADLPALCPLPLDPLDLTILKAAIRKFMALDWKRETVKLLQTEGPAEVPGAEKDAAAFLTWASNS